METYPIDRSDISLAVRLLRKAESTSSDHESAALALRSYSLLAEVINGFEAANGEPRRRDRRLLHDRRARQGEAAGEGRLVPRGAETSPPTPPGGAERGDTSLRRAGDPPTAARGSATATHAERTLPRRGADRRVTAHASEVYARFGSPEPRGVTELWL